MLKKLVKTKNPQLSIKLCRMMSLLSRIKFWYRVNIYGLKVTGAHKHKVESVGLALCLSRDNGDWYFSFVQQNTVVRSVTQNPIILLSVPRRIRRRENLFLALKGKFTSTIIQKQFSPSFLASIGKDSCGVNKSIPLYVVTLRLYRFKVIQI